MGPAKGGILGGLFGHKASPVMWGQGCADRGAAWLLFSKKKIRPNQTERQSDKM